MVTQLLGSAQVQLRSAAGSPSVDRGWASVLVVALTVPTKLAQAMLA